MHFIFDFDGTLVDSFAYIVGKFAHLSAKFRLRKPRPEEIAQLHDLSSTDLIRHLAIPVYRLPAIIYQARKSMHAEMPTLQSFKHLPEVITKLHQAGIRMGILTSNSEQNVKFWLKTHSLDQFFYFIHSEIHFFGKKNSLQKILRRYDLNKTKTFYIGDETRDIEAAKKVGLKAVAVTWGFNSEKVLVKSKPFFIAKKPEDLLTLLSSTP